MTALASSEATSSREDARALHEDVRAFYDAYFEALDEDRIEEWPDFFVDDCLYRIIPRENYEAGQKTCLMQGDSKGMLTDRVRAIRSTQVYAPRYCRRQGALFTRLNTGSAGSVEVLEKKGRSCGTAARGGYAWDNKTADGAYKLPRMPMVK